MRFLLLAIFFTLNLQACALCALYTPTAHASLKFSATQNHLNKIEIKWIFSENFTKLIYQSYDMNANSKLEEKEIKEIKKALLDYLEPRNYLTKFTYFDENNDEKKLDLQSEDTKIFIENARLCFVFSFKIDLELKLSRVLKVLINDDEGYFNFMMTDKDIVPLSNRFAFKPNSNLNSGFYKIITADANSSFISTSSPELSKLNLPEKIDKSEYNVVSKANVDYLDKIRNLLKSKDAPLLATLIISFLYGLFHAAGPGHGKMLTTSYFAANGGSYSKAFFFALKIGVLHVAGALALVCASMFALENLAAKQAADAANITTKFSAIAIIFVACFMLLNKLKKRKIKFVNSPLNLQVNSSKSIQKSAIFAQNHVSNCSCKVCESLSKKRDKSGLQEWLVILSASLTPCPGTILAFTLAFSVSNFALAFFSAVAMSLGMTGVIFVAAVLGKNLNLSFKNIFGIYFEILALFAMIALGIVMFVASNKVIVL